MTERSVRMLFEKLALLAANVDIEPTATPGGR